VTEQEPKKRPGLAGFQKGLANDRRVQIAAGVTAVIVVVLLVVLLGGGGDSSTTATISTQSSTANEKQVSVVSDSELLGSLKGVGYPVYWAGPRLGVKYEVQRLPEGRTYIRYLPKGEEAESEKQFLTVGSYEQANALADLRKLGQNPGAILISIPGGGSAYAEGPDSTSAYLAFPEIDTQVEVFDPQGGNALHLIRSGAIVPVGS
jgi:hypothetical protein